MTTDLELDIAADGQTVTLAVGQSLRLRLAENPTTGYQWSVSSSGDLLLESNLFTPVGAAIGAGGLRELRWRARSAGINRLTLAQRRAWEPIDKAIGRFALTVIVASP
jgi:inhibitor of cysteine peptidase